MRVIIRESEQAVATAVADIFDREIRRRNGAPITLGLATGSSPVGVYTELIRRYREEDLSFRNATVFMLDEYVGLPAAHPQSYARFIRDQFAQHVDIDPARIFAPRGDAPDAHAEAAAYDRAIAEAGGIDLQLLGIGTSGHIAFNEPGSSLASRTRVKTLVEGTIQDNSRFFDDPADVPVHAITQGVATILEARKIVLIATGKKKARAIHETVEGPVSARWTGSALQMHPAATVAVDSAAASSLELASYFRFAESHEQEVPGAELSL